MVYIYLLLAIIAEVVATSALKSSAGFSRLVPAGIVVVGYGVSFYCLSLVLQRMSMGLAYAMWAGIGVFLVWLVGVLIYRQPVDWAGLAGICLIVSGVVVINLFSDISVH